jgi:hypothetical protein
LNYQLKVDTLEFRASTCLNLTDYISGSIYKFPNGVFLERTKDYSLLKQTYPFCFKIQDPDNDIGWLYTKSFDLSLEAGFNITIKINNHIFYSGYLDYHLKRIVEALEIKNTLIKRVDLCYDTDFDVMTSFRTLFYDKSTEFKLKNKLTVIGTGIDDREIHIGRHGAKCVSIYNKTKELQLSQKEYIRNLFQKTFSGNIIYRVELRLMSKLPDIKNINIFELGNTSYLETIMGTYFDTVVKFVEVKGGKKIDFITLNDTGKKIPKVTKIRGQGGEIKNAKMVINFMDKEIKGSGKVKEWKGIREILLKKYELNVWYKMRGK